jgi:uncharacterized protein (DUF2249 family)/iron-sulfur cluster repair protein YtfE (RIC family)
MTDIAQHVDVTVASSAADAAAVVAVEQHHAALAATLGAHVAALLTSAAGGGDDFATARARAGDFLTGELAPHAAAEEDVLYPVAARSERAALLVDGMLAEHKAIAALVSEVTTAADPVRAAAAGYALQVLFDVHLAKENDLVLPVIAGDPATSLADVLAGMHELLGGHDEHGAAPAADSSGSAHHSCGCGESDAGVPELDVRSVPHAIRHATVFGAFDAVPAGGSLLLVAPHDPLPLLSQLSARAGGDLTVSYDQRGPDAWRLLLTRG